ncbi:non-homologous end-joining factor 1 [Alosa sapidissima]|uniref:non-homologous end-joining factor 1 n=1 Tax=Alosa sapidissima TaxID=34773 RepID=UPI001C09D1DC|nr:non-homologous end-joining factor 1 [Alosa sapidissima]XP_041936584.1 non-homologous end-joining factor 1 [Alosa sapidissima]
MEDAGFGEAAVSEQSWVPVQVEDSEFLAKAWFGNTQYRVLLSDLNCVWEEEMQADAIGDRAQELNKRLRASVQAFSSHLRRVVQPRLSGQPGHQDGVEAHLSLLRHDDRLTVRLKSELAGVPFHWEFRLRPAPINVVCKQLVRPLLAITQVLQRQVQELTGLLVRKDAEILDYKENGAVLTRGRLLTDVFDEDRYRQNFFSQTLPQVRAVQESVCFSPELQELYAAVSSQGGRRKRRRSSSTHDTHEQDATPAQTPATGHNTHTQREGASGPGCQSGSDQSLTPSLEVQNPEEPGSQGASGEPQKAECEQTVPQMPVPVDRPAPRPKKKKAVGLFR